jgi:hypothetical protein
MQRNAVLCHECELAARDKLFLHKCIFSTYYSLCYDTCNAMDNQRIIKSKPTIFILFIYNLNHGCCYYSSGAPNMHWPHNWWLNQAVKKGVDCNERSLYTALIIHCVDVDFH